MSLHAGDTIELTPEQPVAGGHMLARTEHGVVFVDGALPGERVRAQVIESKKSFVRAAVAEVLEASPHRVPDQREAIGAAGVGGIEYAHTCAEYARELKQQASADQFMRIGALELLPEILPSPHAAELGMQWRTRVQLAVTASGELGMHAPASHTVLPVAGVPLGVEALALLPLDGLRFDGVERVEFAAADNGGAITLVGVPEPELLKQLVERLDRAPGDWSVLVRTAGMRNRGGRRAEQLTVHHGSGRIIHTVRDHLFDISATGFWQVHADAAEVLSARVLAECEGARQIADLYCGAGLFSVQLADELDAEVYGVEGSAQAIADARGNALLSAANFEVARVEKLRALPDIDTIVLDPPRAGAGRAVVELMASSDAEKIVYVSCDGGTFARDARGLIDAGFSLVKTEGHDFFPLTAHTEFASVFTR